MIRGWLLAALVCVTVLFAKTKSKETGAITNEALIKKASTGCLVLGEEIQFDDFKCGQRPRETQETVDVLVRKLLTLLGGPARDRRIVNGQQAYRGQYPWQAGIGNKHGVNDPFKAWCGGTIIAPRWILTAAHCMYDKDEETQKHYDVQPEDLFVSAGDHELADDNEMDEYHEVKAIYNHQLYNHNTALGNDIALLQLKKPIKFNNFVQPACLPRPGQFPSATHCSISGWGQLKYKGEHPNILMGAEVKIESKENCRKYIRERESSSDNLSNCELDERMCAGHYGKVDTCQGDSGGPLVCKEAGGYTVFGVTSYGIGCGSDQHPGIYTTVSSHLGFIADVMQDAEA